MKSIDAPLSVHFTKVQLNPSQALCELTMRPNHNCRRLHAPR